MISWFFYFWKRAWYEFMVIRLFKNFEIFIIVILYLLPYISLWIKLFFFFHYTWSTENMSSGDFPELSLGEKPGAMWRILFPFSFSVESFSIFCEVIPAIIPFKSSSSSAALSTYFVMFTAFGVAEISFHFFHCYKPLQILHSSLTFLHLRSDNPGLSRWKHVVLLHFCWHFVGIAVYLS